MQSDFKIRLQKLCFSKIILQLYATLRRIKIEEKLMNKLMKKWFHNAMKWPCRIQEACNRRFNGLIITFNDARFFGGKRFFSLPKRAFRAKMSQRMCFPLRNISFLFGFFTCRLHTTAFLTRTTDIPNRTCHDTGLVMTMNWQWMALLTTGN